jgi:hypothetical protein
MGLTNNLGKLSNMITSTGSAVGIAQPSPAYTLDVSGTGRYTGALTGTSATFSSSISATIGNFSNYIVIGGTSGLNTYGSINQPAGEKIIINAYHGLELKTSGGIGSGTPISVFNVSSAGAATFSSTIRSNDSTGFSVGSIAGYRRIEYTGTTFAFLTNADGYANINAGAATFSSTITAGGATFTGDINLNGGEFNSTGRILFDAGAGEGFLFRTNNVATQAMSIISSGWVYLPSITDGAGSYALKWRSGGLLSFDTSSARYKDNIRDSSYGLSDVMKLRSAMFEYKKDVRTDIGLIAEEVYEVIPELVTLNEDGLPDAVSYDRFVSVLIKAVQEQNQIIQELNERLNKAGL